MSDQANTQDTTAGAGAPDANTGQTQPPVQTDPTQKADGVPAAIYKPDGMPDHFAGKDDRETIDRLYKAVDGFRKDQSKGRNVPKTAADYKVELPQELAGKVFKDGDISKDPIWQKMSSKFHEHNLSQEDVQDLTAAFYGIVADIQNGGADAGGEYAADFEYKEVGGTDAAKPLVDGVSAWAQGLKNQGRLSEKNVQEITLMAMHGVGLDTLVKLREIAGEKPLVPAQLSGIVADNKTEAELHAMMRDPKYWRDKDPAFVAKVTEGLKRLYGNQGTNAA